MYIACESEGTQESLMFEVPYFPEGDKETERLEVKTDKQAVIDQALWRA